MNTLKSAIDSGTALEGFRALVEAQGEAMELWLIIMTACRGQKTKDIVLDNDSPMYVEGLDARSFGDAACILGAGRVSTRFDHRPFRGHRTPEKSWPSRPTE